MFIARYDVTPLQHLPSWMISGINCAHSGPPANGIRSTRDPLEKNVFEQLKRAGESMASE